MKIIKDDRYISKLADIEDSIKGSCLTISEDVHIDSFVKIKFAGGIGDIYIGKRTYINSGCVLYSGNGIIIGDNVMIAANCTFAPTNHKFESINVPMIDQGFMESKGGILIEDDVWVGSNCVLLDGAILRKGCIIAAGSVVRGEIAPYTIAAGTPAKIMKRR